MGIFDFISNIFSPVVDLIDDVTTSDEEKLKLKNKLQQIQNQMSMKILEYETKLMESKASIIESEATGHSWIQRNWRPITMLTFLVLVVLNSFGVLQTKLAPEAWSLLKIGLGGYVVGRSAEKIVPYFKKKKDAVEAKG
jgi:hypothetical protein